MRPVALKNLHVTLLFAGQIDDGAARDLGAAVAGLDGAPTRATLTRIGGFPAGASTVKAGVGPRKTGVRARVLAAELEVDPRLLTWQTRLADAWPAGEDRPFRAHVTLARAGRMVRIPEVECPPLTVDLEAPVLLESLTLPEGARYLPLAY